MFSFNKVSLLIISFIIILTYSNSIKTEEITSPVIKYEKGDNSNIIPSALKMYIFIEKYSEIYKVPKYIAYNIAYKETSYRGPFDWNYNPSRTSWANAYGPMQIQVPTANYIANMYWGKNDITKEDLLNNLELNISLSMQIMSHLKDHYDTWDRALGAYNTGRPIINSYASYCYDTKIYKAKWLYI